MLKLVENSEDVAETEAGAGDKALLSKRVVKKVPFGDSSKNANAMYLDLENGEVGSSLVKV